MKGFICFACCTLALVIVTSPAPAADDIRNAAEAAACMAQILKGAPNAKSVRTGEIERGRERYSYLAYGFSDETGHYREVGLELAPDDNNVYNYSLNAAIDGRGMSPITPDVTGKWELQCHARGILTIR
jgi:hypothetical protein